MANLIKLTPSVVRRSKRDDSGDKEYKFLQALVQLGMSKLLDAVKSDKVLMGARDLRDLQKMKAWVATDNLDEASIYFITCNACLFSKSCSLYETGGNCRFNLAETKISNSKDIVRVLTQLLEIEKDRIQRSLLIEKLDGVVDKEVSSEMMLFFDMVERFKSILSTEESISIKVQGKGVISQIFGSMLAKQAEAEDVIVNVTPKNEVFVEVDSGDKTEGL